jgi:hypothetical protein
MIPIHFFSKRILFNLYHYNIVNLAKEIGKITLWNTFAAISSQFIYNKMFCLFAITMRNKLVNTTNAVL